MSLHAVQPVDPDRQMLDMSNWTTPYDGTPYLTNWAMITGAEPLPDLRGLGQTPPQGRCNFVEGPSVTAIQSALLQEGELTEDQVTGVFDDATCAAWDSVYADRPNAESLSRALRLGPEDCPSLTLPKCPNIPPRVLGLRPWQLAVGGALGAVALLYAYDCARKR